MMLRLYGTVIPEGGRAGLKGELAKMYMQYQTTAVFSTRLLQYSVPVCCSIQYQSTAVL